MMIRVFFALLFLCLGSSYNRSSAEEARYQWVQLSSADTLIVRSIEEQLSCPNIRIDGSDVEMEIRATASQGHPGIVCEKAIPRSVRSAVLSGHSLPLLKREVRRVVVIGDTGCRIQGRRVQACNNDQAWPLDAIVAGISSQDPDLVIHVGDFIYRSTPCPSSGDCQGSPHGDRLATWVADWFGPAQSLMRQVPFLFVRGNHETCGRNAAGWFRYLANGAVPVECPAVSAPWKARLDGLDLIAFDVAAGTSPRSDPSYLSVYREDADRIFQNLQEEAWFLTHRPMWAYLDAFGTTITGDETQKAAFGRAMPSAITLIVSGHIHIAQALDMEAAPIQLIAGNSGTQLDPAPLDRLENIEIGVDVARGIYGEAGFGFLVLDRIEKSIWQVKAMDQNGVLRRRCVAEGRALTCGDLIK